MIGERLLIVDRRRAEGSEHRIAQKYIFLLINGVGGDAWLPLPDETLHRGFTLAKFVEKTVLHPAPGGSLVDGLELVDKLFVVDKVPVAVDDTDECLAVPMMGRFKELHEFRPIDAYGIGFDEGRVYVGVPQKISADVLRPLSGKQLIGEVVAFG